MTNQHTILLVDDELIALDILEGFLLPENYQLCFANNGAEALAQVEKFKPDVILLDVMMPNMDGFEVCRRLKSDELWRYIPIILVTALGGREDMARGLESGADDFIHKPVDDVELRARVRSMLRIKGHYEALQATLRLREDLAHMIAHDMRSPLSVISGYADWMLTKGTAAPDDLADIKKIHAQAQYLNAFLNDMLILAKMDAEHLILNRSIVDINEIVIGLRTTHLITSQSREIQLVTDLPEKSPQISLDRNLFQRALDNLVSNALKFSPLESTVTIRVEVPENEQADPQVDPALRIKVIDEGPGISKEYRERIFERFEVVPMKERDISQIGLGLAFCKLVIEAHEGLITVEAHKPTGSIFVIELR